MLEQLKSIQGELKCNKNQYNNFGKYKYRSCEDILEAVKPLLQKNNCTLILSDEIIAVDERIYVKATASIYDVASGDTISAVAFAREEADKKGQDASQITGTASSYARKYALNGLFCIDDTKDADATNTHGKKEEYAGSDNDPLGSKPICAYCAKPITDTEYNGKKYTARQIAAMSQEKYGVPLHIECADSYKAIKDGGQDAE